MRRAQVHFLECIIIVHSSHSHLYYVFPQRILLEVSNCSLNPLPYLEECSDIRVGMAMSGKVEQPV